MSFSNNIKMTFYWIFKKLRKTCFLQTTSKWPIFLFRNTISNHDFTISTSCKKIELVTPQLCLQESLWFKTIPPPFCTALYYQFFPYLQCVLGKNLLGKTARYMAFFYQRSRKAQCSEKKSEGTFIKAAQLLKILTNKTEKSFSNKWQMFQIYNNLLATLGH